MIYMLRLGAQLIFSNLLNPDHFEQSNKRRPGKKLAGLVIGALGGKALSSLESTMMEIQVAAIVHADPLCRGRLRRWLRELLAAKGSQPAFVAVEWDEQMFQSVRALRPVVCAKASEKWPGATSEFIDALASAVAFGGDTHHQLMPDVPTIWLDTGRDLPYPDAIEVFADQRINGYANLIPSETTRFDANLLRVMSYEAWDRNRPGERPEGGTNRDAKFAKVILARAPDYTGDWAAAIVGANHASRDQGYMVNRLQESGGICIVSELRPESIAS
jgi:hypothetical protein